MNSTYVIVAFLIVIVIALFSGLFFLVSDDGNRRRALGALAIRIGLHAGPLIEEQGDVFGDTVNTAARMASLAKADQIITTFATVALMSPLLRVVLIRERRLLVRELPPARSTSSSCESMRFNSARC